MPWSDKSVSPVIYTPHESDVDNMILDSIINISNGGLGFSDLPYHKIVAHFRAGNWELDGNGRIYQWNDRISGYAMTQSNESVRPAVTDGMANFSYNSPRLMVPRALMAHLNDKNKLSIVLRWKWFGNNSFSTFLMRQDDADNQYGHLYCGSQVGNFRLGCGGYFDTPIAFYTNIMSVIGFCLEYKYRTQAFNDNGISQYVYNQNSKFVVNDLPWVFGNRYDGARPLNAYVADVFFLNDVLEAEEINMFRNYQP